MYGNDSLADLLSEYEQDLLEQYQRAVDFFLIFAQREDYNNAYFYLRSATRLLSELGYA